MLFDLSLSLKLLFQIDLAAETQDSHFQSQDIQEKSCFLTVRIDVPTEVLVGPPRLTLEELLHPLY